MDRIPLFPLDVGLFPGESFGLHVFEERCLLMDEEARIRAPTTGFPVLGRFMVSLW